jgi:Asp/Glu/hydantoin racemase
MNKKMAIVHTGFVSVDPLACTCADICPQVELVNIVDDSLLRDIMVVGRPTPKIIQRMCWYFAAAEQLGAGLIVNACSSVGEIADIAARTVGIPVVRIDAGMSKAAVDLGTRIALVATTSTTVGPSKRLIESAAKEKQKEVKVTTYLCDNAFKLLSEGDKEGYSSEVIDKIYAVAKENDVIVLAQVSMAPLLDKIGDDMDVPVLASPRRGIREAAHIIGIL